MHHYRKSCQPHAWSHHLPKEAYLWDHALKIGYHPGVNVTSLPHSVCVSTADRRCSCISRSNRVHHTLCERLASSAAQVEAVDEVIFGLSSSSSVFLPLTTDREILTKKMQTINPQPAEAAP